MLITVQAVVAFSAGILFPTSLAAAPERGLGLYWRLGAGVNPIGCHGRLVRCAETVCKMSE